MKYEKPLSDYYLLYNKGDMSKKELEGKIFKYLLENPDRYHLFDGNRDRWGEFLSWLYTRLSRAVDLYRDMGSSFDAYITVLVHNTAKEYRSREADHYLTEYVCWQARAEEMKLFESEPEYCESKKSDPIPKDINPRQLLFLLLKSYYFATDEMVKQVARANGLGYNTVRKMIDEIRMRRSGKETEIRELRERLYLQHYRCLAHHKRMNYAQPGTDYHTRMKDRFERARKRYYAMKKRLEGMRKSASNKMIADILGIPLGTVDSGLSVIKNRMAVFADLC